MNKNIKIYLGLFLALIILLSGNIVSATTGGPTYINNLKYNPQNESVYYMQYDYGGRGCPPELMKISLVDGKTEAVYSCDQAEKVLSPYYQAGQDFNAGLLKVSTEINKIVANFKELSPINLKKNNIDIDLQFVKSENFEFDPEYIKNSIFNATVSQNGKKIMEKTISGCNTEQPFTFMGYAIPGFDKKIIVLLSAKGDCFEGGYTRESLFVVGGLDNLQKEYLNYYKGDDPLTPNEGTLTIYANETTLNTNTDEKPESVTITETMDKDYLNNPIYELFNNSKPIISVFIIGAIILGFILGRVIKRNKKLE